MRMLALNTPTSVSYSLPTRRKSAVFSKASTLVKKFASRSTSPTVKPIVFTRWMAEERSCACPAWNGTSELFGYYKTDGTRDAVTAVGLADDRVRLLHRRGRRGLASAFIEGVECSLAPYVAAMDGDLQHDEALLPQMLEVLRSGATRLMWGLSSNPRRGRLLAFRIRWLLS